MRQGIHTDKWGVFETADFSRGGVQVKRPPSPARSHFKGKAATLPATRPRDEAGQSRSSRPLRALIPARCFLD